MKVSASAAFEVFIRIVRVSELRYVSRQFGKGVGDKADVLQGAQLVSFHTAVVMHLVHLQVAQAKHEIGGATMAGSAFRAAWITPGLLPDSARSAPILDGEFLFLALGPHQRGV